MPASDNIDNDFPSPPSPPALDGLGAESETINWLMNQVEESEAFLAAQPGYSRIGAAIDAIMSSDTTEIFDTKSVTSKTRTNRIAKIAEDLAAMLTDTKPFWDYSVANKRFEQHAQIYGKLSTFWYQRRNIDLRLGDAIKYYVVAGTGYLHTYWDPDTSDIACRAEDPRDVLPIRPANYESLDSCQGVIVKRKVPVHYIKDRYGVDVTADSDGSSVTMFGKIRESAADIVSPIWKFRKAGKEGQALPKIPTVTLYTCYLKDPRLHDGSKPKEMGKWRTDLETGTRSPVTNWSYLVQPKQPLYPNRRLIVWCGDRILYDGPSFYWHGEFPIIKITLNPFPWSWFGKAPVTDLLSLQTSLNRSLRIVDNHLAQVANPGAVVDKNNVSRAQFDSLDTSRPGYKIWQNPMAGKGVQIVNPPPMDQTVGKHIEWIQNEMKELSGVADMSNLMKLGQLPSNSTVETLIQSMTPALRLRSRIMESVFRVLAMQVAYNFTQFYTLPVRVSILGPGGITQDDFDFDPGSLMPDFVHDRDYHSDGSITPDAFLRGPLPKYDRAKEFMRRFIFKIAPGSLLNAAQVEQRLIYLQLARAGWMDIFTLWETLGIPNIGVLPDNVRTIPERLQYQQQIGLSGDVNAAGRKASGQEIPRLVTKES